MPEGITPENIIREVYHRNPTIMKVLSKIKYVEEVGEGWDRIIEEIENHPLKSKIPKIEDTGLSVTVTIYSPEGFEFIGMDLNERQRKAISFLREHGRIANKDYRKLFPDLTDKTVYRDIQDLVKKV